MRVAAGQGCPKGRAGARQGPPMAALACGVLPGKAPHTRLVAAKTTRLGQLMAIPP